MLSKKKLLLIIIPGLVVLNLLQWFPYKEHETTDNIQINSNQINTHELRVSGFETSDKYIKNIHRDLFFIKNPSATNSLFDEKATKPLRKKITTKNISISTKKNQDVSGIRKIKLEAVLFNNGKKSAYLIIGDNTYTIKKGDIIKKLYIVEDVSASTVTLREIKTHKSSIVSMQ